MRYHRARGPLVLALLCGALLGACAARRAFAQGGGAGGSFDLDVPQHIGARAVLVARPLDSTYMVTAVRFLLDGKTLAEVGPPGRFMWDTSRLRAGRHLLQVQAFSGEQFVGQSAPTAIMVDPQGAGESLVEVPFLTHQIDHRRGSTVVAPRLKTESSPTRVAQATIAPASGASAGRLTGIAVDVYIDGVKQDFAPAARLASAEELAPRRGGTTRQSKRRSSRSRVARTVRSTPTVWLPARPLLEKLGARVRWETKSQTLRAELNVGGSRRRISLRSLPGSASGARGAAVAEIDGHQYELQVPVRQAENALMVPLDFCTQALNLRVNWRKSHRRVEMFTPMPPL